MHKNPGVPRNGTPGFQPHLPPLIANTPGILLGLITFSTGL
ncbi:hypothetical protein [Serratia proteamaculans]